MLLSNFLSVVCLSLPLLLVVTRPALTCQTSDELQAAHRSSVNSETAPSANSIMETHQVVPNVIPTAPAAVLKVTYPGGVQVDGGAELTPTQVKEVPQLEWQAEQGALYTVVMTDPDAPSRADPKFGEWRHWLVVNVPATDVSGGEAVSEYVGSGPPQGTGLHRYVFLVYKQPGKLTVDAALKKTKNQAKGREKWSVRQFAEKHGLGVPVAGNLYQAQWDDYVPQLYKQFTD